MFLEFEYKKKIFSYGKKKLLTLHLLAELHLRAIKKSRIAHIVRENN